MSRYAPTRVRIKSTEETQRLGFAGREGLVHGWTTPTVTGVKVIGSPQNDFAIVVHFDDAEEGFWFSEDLVETVG